MADNPRKIVVALLLFAVVAVYVRTVSFDFVAWDDDVNIFINKNYAPVTAEHTLRFWTGAFEHFYTPLTYTVWAVLVAISPTTSDTTVPHPLVPSPFLFHLLNLFLHAASTLLVWEVLLLCLRRFGDESRAIWPACAGALLFALHPMQAEPVSWVSGMRDLLSGFFSLLALRDYLTYAGGDPALGRSLEKAVRRPLYLAFLFYFLGLLTKPTTIMLPLVAAALDLMVLRRNWRKIARVCVPWLLCSAPYVLLTMFIQRHDVGMSTPVIYRPWIMLDSFAFFMGKLIYPFPLICDYLRKPMVVMSRGYAPFTAVFPLFLGLFVWRLGGELRWIAGAGLAVFLLWILPTSGILTYVSQNESTVFDRYLYLALIGPALVLAWTLVRYPTRLAWGLTVIGLLVCAAGSFNQSRFWRNTLALFQHTIDVDPDSFVGTRGLGLYFQNLGRAEIARQYFARAHQLAPEDDWVTGHFNELSPDKVALSHSLDQALAAIRRKDLESARGILEEVLKREPANYQALVNLGTIYALKGNLDVAIQDFSRAIHADPKNAAAYENLAHAYQLKGEPEKAESVQRMKRDLASK